MGLRDKYSQAIVTAKQLGMEGSADEKDGKLHFHGTVKSEDEKNQIWNALKTVPDWQKEVVADIKVRAGALPSTPGTPQQAPAPQAAPSAAQLRHLANIRKVLIRHQRPASGVFARSSVSY